ncbi:MAG: type II toxin-antitoxin system HicB family antitoxin, partial [Anaerolineales bacterium]|nr:type II toxin-antitoxin system HicB family antitoxin [Anaerolineales bacterium]
SGNGLLFFGDSAQMQSNKCRMLITWSDEDQAYIVEVPELPGCMADGKTRQEALANAEIIIQEWLEAAHDSDMLPEYDFSKGERGKFYKPLSKGYSVTITHPDGTTTTEHYKLIDGAVLLDPDVRAYFPDSESVNTALRSLIKMMADIPARGKRYVQRPQSAHRVSEK